MEPSRIYRAEAPVRRRHSNPPKIRHSCLGGHFSEDGVAIETEIGTKRRSEKHYITDLDAVVFQHMHVRVLSDVFDLGN